MSKTERTLKKTEVGRLENKWDIGLVAGTKEVNGKYQVNAVLSEINKNAYINCLRNKVLQSTDQKRAVLGSQVSQSEVLQPHIM